VCACRCEEGRRAVTRRRRCQRARLPGRRAARRARGHGRERLPGRYTPVPSRDVRINLVVVAGRLPPGPSAGDAPRGRYAIWAIHRAPGLRVRPERANLRNGPPAGSGLLAQLSFPSRPSAQRRRKQGVGRQTSEVVCGLLCLALLLGRNPDPSRTKSAGPPTAQQRFWPFSAC
jgi:hypothetical protein